MCLDNVIAFVMSASVALSTGKVMKLRGAKGYLVVILFSSMSDSEDSTVTYTKISSPYKDLSDIGPPGAGKDLFFGSPSPVYVPGPLRSQSSTTSLSMDICSELFTRFQLRLSTDRGDDRDDEEPSDDDDDDDDDAEEEEHLAPADPTAVAYSADQDPYLAYRVTARMSIRHQAPAPFLSEEVAERLLALPTPPPSPLSPYSSPLPQIPSPPLPISSPPPNGPTYVEGSLGSRAAGIRQRDALPSPVHETEMPEICLPLRKRPRRTTPGPGYEVGESSAAGAARQFGPTTAEADLYGFADMLDAAPGRQTSKELGYGITDTWDDLVGAIQEIAPTTLEGVNQRVTELVTTVDQEDEIIYSQLDDARYDRALLRARVNMLYRDRPFHRRTALLIEEEARLSRAAWARSMDACDQVHSEGISLRTTVMAQQSEITELQAADRRRQAVITDLLKADYRRQNGGSTVASFENVISFLPRNTMSDHLDPPHESCLSILLGKEILDGRMAAPIHIRGIVQSSRNFVEKSSSGQSDSGNDHCSGAIIGLLEIMFMGDSEISGFILRGGDLDFNLFSCRQFCDSDLEVASESIHALFSCSLLDYALLSNGFQVYKYMVVACL
ncbi:hypothetical protein Tco_1375834 [Tanacetum coccineum]